MEHDEAQLKKIRKLFDCMFSMISEDGQKHYDFVIQQLELIIEDIMDEKHYNTSEDDK